MLRTLLLMLGLVLSIQTQATTLKIATLAPDGTSWMKAMRNAAKEVAERTKDRVKLRFYPGGVMGNDKSVLRKMRIGQLHGGALTAGGLADIYPNIQIYSLPFLFNSFEEVDHIRQQFDPVIISGLKKQGLISYGLTEGGFVHFMCQAPIVTLEELRARKVWAPEGDAVSRNAFEALDITPIPLPLTDVLTGLQTGLIDTIASSPVATIALQWHTKVKYLNDTPVLYLHGTLVIQERALQKLSQPDRKILREVLESTFLRINKQSRRDNRDALEALRKQGLQFVTPPAENLARWRSLMDKAIEKMGREGVYSAALLSKIRKSLEHVRQTSHARSGQ